MRSAADSERVPYPSESCFLQFIRNLKQYQANFRELVKTVYTEQDKEKMERVGLVTNKTFKS